MSNKKKLEQVFGEIQPGNWIVAARKQKEDAGWLQYSQELALTILELMDQKNMKQKDLAEQMNVSPQVINKWIKGKENFTLQTVSKLEAVFGIKLLKVELLSYQAFIPTVSITTHREEYIRPNIPIGKSIPIATKIISMSQKDYAKAN